jgi:aminopeptidase N
VFNGIIRSMQQWSMVSSDQGAVYLGYRVGHFKGDGRLFRAVIYDKGAMVLHMLRRLVGDEAFFAGLRRYYYACRFQKAGTDDLRRAMEAESGVDLGRFFERWIYGEGLPQVAFTWRLEPRDGNSEAVLRFEQTGEIFDFAVTVTFEYPDNKTTTTIVKVTDRVVEARVPVKGRPRRVDANRDLATVGVFR